VIKGYIPGNTTPYLTIQCLQLQQASVQELGHSFLPSMSKEKVSKTLPLAVLRGSMTTPWSMTVVVGAWGLNKQVIHYRIFNPDVFRNTKDCSWSRRRIWLGVRWVQLLPYCLDPWWIIDIHVVFFGQAWVVRIETVGYPFFFLLSHLGQFQKVLCSLRQPKEEYGGDETCSLPSIWQTKEGGL